MHLTSLCLSTPFWTAQGELCLTHSHFGRIYSQSVHFISFHFSRSVMSNSLWPHGLQHPRPPCPLPTPRVYSNMSTESVMTSKHLIVCRPLLLSSSIFPSIRVFSNESALRTRWPEYWSFSFNISPSNEHLVIWNYAKLVWKAEPDPWALNLVSI